MNVRPAAAGWIAGRFERAAFAEPLSVCLHAALHAGPLLTEVVPLADAVRGFDLASDRSRAMKVLLAF